MLPRRNSGAQKRHLSNSEAASVPAKYVCCHGKDPCSEMDEVRVFGHHLGDLIPLSRFKGCELIKKRKMGPSWY